MALFSFFVSLVLLLLVTKGACTSLDNPPYLPLVMVLVTGTTATAAPSLSRRATPFPSALPTNYQIHTMFGDNMIPPILGAAVTFGSERVLEGSHGV